MLFSESLEAATIVVDGGVVLMTPKELLLQKNATLELVVGEEPVQLGPHGAGIITVRHDRLEEVGRDGEEKPADDRGVDGGPVMKLGDEAGVDGAVHVVDEMILPEHEGEVRLPRVVGGVRLRETNRHPLEDVEVADVVDVGRVGVGERVGVGGRRRRNG